MPRSFRWGLALSLLFLSAAVWAQPTDTTVGAIVESSLKTDGKQIRQYAFDGNADTYFASENNPAKADHFTLTFDKPVAVKSIHVTTGKPKGDDALEAGILEVSADGKEFVEAAKFAKGGATVTLSSGKKCQAIRVRPTEDMTHPLAIREFVIESEPKVLTFKYPVEFVVDVSAAPESKAWAEKAARICERNYSMICEELKSDGFKPLTVIKMKMSGYNGVAFASGGRIEGSAAYFKKNPDDFGAMIHETCHCVQMYRGGRPPGWLVEGIPDYIRFFKYEPNSPATARLRKLKPEQAKYNGSYRTTAAFLAFVTEYTKDKDFVRKLNAAIREGKYGAETWKELTGKTVEELSQEWKKSLAG